jgi:hypothetical protein
MQQLKVCKHIPIVFIRYLTSDVIVKFTSNLIRTLRPYTRVILVSELKSLQHLPYAEIARLQNRKTAHCRSCLNVSTTFCPLIQLSN